MNKSELVDSIATKTGLTKAAAADAADAFITTIMDTVAAGDTVNLIGFGSFRSTLRSERTGKNPKTGEPLVIPAAKAPKFTPGAPFKAKVNK